jgi:hypothetical protein
MGGIFVGVCWHDYFVRPLIFYQNKESRLVKLNINVLLISASLIICVDGHHNTLISPAVLLSVVSHFTFDVHLFQQHPVRHRHDRHKRQHAHATSQTYLPGSFVVDGGASTPESGNWGPWSEPSDCSRSCGGGVAFQTRRCRDVR